MLAVAPELLAAVDAKLSNRRQMPEKPYEFSTHIGVACARKMVNYQQLADKLKMDVNDLMRQCNARRRHRKRSSRDWSGSWTSTSSFLRS
jgi:hypothetical protein